jgi:hypothetical protein
MLPPPLAFNRYVAQREITAVIERIFVFMAHTGEWQLSDGKE